MRNVKTHQYELDGVPVTELTHITDNIASMRIFKTGFPGTKVRQKKFPLASLKSRRTQLQNSFITAQRLRDGR